MTTKHKNPEVRFKGIREDWEYQEFNLLFKSISNNTLSRDKLNYFYGNAKNVHYGDILVKYNEILDVGNNVIPYVTENQVAEKLKSTRLADGDIVIADAAEDKIVGKSVEIINISNEIIFSGLHTIAVRPKQKFAKMYLGYYMNSDAYHNQLLTIMQGTKVFSVSKSAIKSTIIRYPENETEQKQIGSFFENINSLISLHQSKYDKLIILKKAMLEKMFPRDVAVVPKIRFKGFTEDWEEKELGMIANRYDNLRIPITENKRVPGITPYYGANGIQDYVQGYTHKGEFILIAEDGANDLKNYPVQYVDGEIWVNNHAHVLQSKNTLANNKFLQYVISTTNIEPFLVGGGRAKLNAEVMMKIKVTISSDIKEQEKIGEYFKNLDTQISLHQVELTKLQNIKKGCFSKMFVS